MKDMNVVKRFGAKVVGTAAVVGTAVVASPAFAYVSEATAEIGAAKSGGETIAPLVIGAVAVIVGVSIIISMLRKA